MGAVPLRRNVDRTWKRPRPWWKGAFIPVWFASGGLSASLFVGKPLDQGGKAIIQRVNLVGQGIRLGVALHAPGFDDLLRLVLSGLHLRDALGDDGQVRYACGI